MENLEIKETERTPKISFNSTNGRMEIVGSSIPEDCLDFYKPIFAWLEAYTEGGAYETRLDVHLKFFNTSTSKCLFTIFKRLEKLHKSGNKASIFWHYVLKDTDMYESGVDFSNMLSMPFKVVRAD